MITDQRIGTHNSRLVNIHVGCNGEVIYEYTPEGKYPFCRKCDRDLRKGEKIRIMLKHYN